MDPKQHWEQVYGERQSDEVSWYQARPSLSLELIRAAAPNPKTPVVDIGGGASTLVDHLLAAGYSDVTVLDLSARALEEAQTRLGSDAGRVSWIEADATDWAPPRSYLVWHDRAVFHFLIDAEARAGYRAVLERALAPGGEVIIQTFSLEGPEQCSGLPVQRYDPYTLAQELGAGFEVVETRSEVHVTPNGKRQPFIACRFRRLAS